MSVSHSCGLMVLSLQHSMRVAITAQLSPPSSEPANNAFLRLWKGMHNRKNWLFAGSKVGGERAVAIYTVIETCKMNGIEPQAYIAAVIAKIAADWPAARWDELMPWNWQPTQHAKLAA